MQLINVECLKSQITVRLTTYVDKSPNVDAVCTYKCMKVDLDIHKPLPTKCVACYHTLYSVWTKACGNVVRRQWRESC